MRRLYPFIDVCDSQSFKPMRHKSARLYNQIQPEEQNIKHSSITLRIKLKSSDRKFHQKQDTISKQKEQRSKKLLTMLKYQKVKVNKIKKDNSLYDHEYLRRKPTNDKNIDTSNVDLRGYLKANLARLNQCEATKPQLQPPSRNYKNRFRMDAKEQNQKVQLKRSCQSMENTTFRESMARSNSGKFEELLCKIRAMTFEKFEVPKVRYKVTPGNKSKTEEDGIKGWD